MDNVIMEKIRRLDIPRLIFALIIGLYLFNCAKYPINHLIDGFNLLMHEAGHWIFMFGGTFIMFLGGSLNQILIPTIFCLYFLFKRDFYSAAILAMLVGYNFVSVSLYMGDAIRMQLPLLGQVDGDTSNHDWNNLLVMTNTLKYTYIFSNVTKFIGFVVMAIGFVFSMRFSSSLEDDTSR